MDTPSINSETPVRAPVERPADAPVQKKVAPKDVKQAPEIDPVAIDPVAAIKELTKAVEVLNEAMARDPVALKFSVDDTLNRPVVTVISEETGKVLHQLPQEEVLRAVKNIDFMRGVLFEDIG